MDAVQSAADEMKVGSWRSDEKLKMKEKRMAELNMNGTNYYTLR